MIMADINILVVDDESRMRKLINDFLKAKGYNILEAADGEEALKTFEEQSKKINLILLDVMMPKLDGWSVLRQIRQKSDVPIIMLTARGEEQDELFGFELGVDEYITKPFSPKILVARVEAILKRTKSVEKELKDYGGIVIDSDGRTVEVDSKKSEYIKYNNNIEYIPDKLYNNGCSLRRELCFWYTADCLGYEAENNPDYKDNQQGTEQLKKIFPGQKSFYPGDK